MKSKKNLIVDTNAPAYEPPPKWIPPHERWNNENYNSNLTTVLPRRIRLERFEDSPLGFNVRGGSANEYGVYISRVLEGSEAERIGLKQGDKILQINKVDFTDIPHAEAVEMLQTLDVLDIEVQYFPYGFKLQQQRIGLI